MIKVLIVEDSPVTREFLTQTLSSDPDIRVIGSAANGNEAIDFVKRSQPDVITMDIHMPIMDGLEATRKIMENMPTPIVIVSGSADPKDVTMTFRATEAGALAFLQKPNGIGHTDHENDVKELINTVKLMSEVRVVRRWPKSKPDSSLQDRPSSAIQVLPSRFRIVAIGASTGGPPVIQTILSGLPDDFLTPVLIVQHMASGFIQGFVEWLQQSCSLPIHLASHGEMILPGHVYVAPDSHQMKVGFGGRILLTNDDPENGLRPSVSYLFRSIGEIYGNSAIAGILTGMGRDGAEELKLLKMLGATTFAQDKESSVVYGMPGEAARIDAARLILSPDKIASTLTNLVSRVGKS